MSKKQKQLPWIKLGGKEEPPFDIKLAIWLKTKGGDDYWVEAWLDKIETRSNSTVYEFSCGESKYDNATHFMVIPAPIELPKE